MRKNKIGDILFGLLLLGFIISSLNGCGQAEQPPPAAAQRASTVTVEDGDHEIAIGDNKDDDHEIAVGDNEDDDHETALGDDEDNVIEVPQDDMYVEPEEPENDVYESIEDTGNIVDSREIEIETKTDADMASIESIDSVCGLVAPVETDTSICNWDSYGDHPYDVVYDFGEEYQAYVDACDWSLVFDADYYMSQYPMLALQYHYDEEELLFHFQTIGVHEGRQGNGSFNVGAYLMNCDYDIYKAFKHDYEGYYLYYMLNYDTEKDVNTLTCDDMSQVLTQYDFRPTAYQLEELSMINEDRAEVGTDDLIILSELCAFANYRAYLNAHDGYEAHDWAIKNIDTFRSYITALGGTVGAENTVTFQHGNCTGTMAEPYYRRSEGHYNAMVNGKYNYMGASNVCNGTRTSSQFDFFINDTNQDF